MTRDTYNILDQLGLQKGVFSIMPLHRSLLSGSKTARMLAVVCTISVSLNIILFLYKHSLYANVQQDAALAVVDYRQLMQRNVVYNVKRNVLVTNSSEEFGDVSKERSEKIKGVVSFLDKIQNKTIEEECDKPVVNGIIAAGWKRSMGRPLCALNPPGIEGPIKAITEDVTPEALIQLFPFMKNGGRLRPKHCEPHQRLAIIIPYRNRYPHLHIMLRNLVPVLQKQLVDATFFVIEQALPSTFNRGALLNVGFLEALKMADFDCFVFHDVDLMPLDDRNFYRCGDNPRHYAVTMNKYRFKIRYIKYFGGVVGFSKNQYINVNGNSNLYFGWGGEDDDLATRIFNKNYTMDRYDTKIARYFMIKHKRDQGNEKNGQRWRIMKTQVKRQDEEGLSTTIYSVNNITAMPLYTWINVSLDMKLLLYTAPQYAQNDMWAIFKMLERGLIH